MPILTYENDIITYVAMQDSEGIGIILGPVCTISFLYFFLYGKQITEHDLILFDTDVAFQPRQYNPFYQIHMMDNSDQGKKHHSYLDERTIIGQVASGDVESIRKYSCTVKKRATENKR